MKQDFQNGIKLENVSGNLKKMFLIIKNVGIKTNLDVKVKNSLIKDYEIKDLFGILVIVSVNVTKLVMLENIQTKKIVKAEKYQWRKESMNVLKLLKK